MEARIRFHGWHWWKGIGNDRTSEGKRPVVPKWWAVYCWKVEGAGYAASACWAEPLKQADMDPGGWGDEILPPGCPDNTPVESYPRPACSVCPFCGQSEVKLIRATPGSPAWSVCCSMCNAVGPFDADMAEAVRLWNQRANRRADGSRE